MINLDKINNIHLIGIGGASMYTIAAMLKNDGKNITGSDLQDTENIEHLRNLGIKITIGSDPNLLKNTELVIYTSAISDSDTELQYAKNNNIPTLDRAQFLGLYTKDYKNLLCISGTHGKSTTTSMVASIFLEANLKPTVSLGAALKKINGNYHIGSKEYFILEACEYVDSFLHLKPTNEIILNIDNDHLDYFKNLENVKKSYLNYAKLLPEHGHLILNIDDPNTHYLKDLKNTLTYSIKDNNAYINARNITFSNKGFPTFDVYINNLFYENISLNVLGTHNISNTLAAIGMSLIYEIDKKIVKKALNEYTGIKRRFEYLGTYKNALIFDDFAHHPTEIESTYNSSKNVLHNKTWAVFQSHTFSRTYEHLNDFANILAQFDNIIICDIYPARETNIWQVKESDLVDLIKQKNKNVLHIPTYEEIADYLEENVQDEDLILTIGAGPINNVANILLKRV